MDAGARHVGARTSAGDERTRPRAFLFAGGGSGGHIYPGLAIASKLRERARAMGDAEPEILFVCSTRAVDARVLEGSGEKHRTCSAQPLIARPAGLVRFVMGWRKAVNEGRSMLRELAVTRASGANAARENATNVTLVAMGGFVAAPLVQAARREGVRVVMVNLDAVPGKANRWIAPRADRVFTAAPVDASFAAWTTVPPVVRFDGSERMTRAAARAKLGLDPARPVLMVTGGSQGLRTLNDFVLAYATSAAGSRVLNDGRWQVLHQTGRNLDGPAREAYQRAGVDARVEAFVPALKDWWAACDLCVCTAGAGNVGEAWASATPALMLPYPFHADQHQKQNARVLETAGGVRVVTDHIDAGANLTHNGPALEQLLTDASTRERMRAALEALGPADGADRIARALLDAD